ncbi:unnamed protein product [Mytilus edulis]|uniref:C2H2-type domain-containing protein n=1 Tax=Mytilus edulis TaxID=6550 RepID=A0A8S3QBZ5_MYTED|nr:unnamed protein product [Mytilus edulis]
MSSKSDFLSWDDSDLNLDLLLGDFTASDIESEDDYVPPAKTAKPQKEATTASANNTERQALYQCSDCDKTYSSVSGFRGHLRTKHSLSSIKGMYSKHFFHTLLNVFSPRKLSAEYTMKYKYSKLFSSNFVFNTTSPTNCVKTTYCLKPTKLCDMI